MLRVFIKKSQKTPAKEIDLAKKRLAEVLMKLVSHKELHNEWMQDDEYRAAWQEEERKEKLRSCLLNGASMTT
jgi:hypothetical protein